MGKYAVLIGNDINNVVSGNSWSDLLAGLISYLSIKVDFPKDKPFPLAYEEIYFKTVKSTPYDERDIKKYVANNVSKLKHGEIHQQINLLRTENILTTNYDLSLEFSAGHNGSKLKNSGYISESKYSIFRKHLVREKNYWHIHGSAMASTSITLGYEHYSGYLQHLRNYVVTGTKDTYKKRTFPPLIKRLKDNKVEFESWVDLFFTTDIHIFGLSLEFVETDLWWLLTFREKIRCAKKLDISNEISYYIPNEYTGSSKSKIDMLKSVGVSVIPINGYKTSKTEYYKSIISKINSNYA